MSLRVEVEMLTMADAMRAMRHFGHSAGADPYGLRTLEGAKAAYVRGDIDLDEYERRAGFLVAGRSVSMPTDEDRVLARAVVAAKMTRRAA